MTAWWKELSIREQSLVGGLAMFAAAFFTFQLIWMPLVNWKTDAAGRESRALNGLQMVASAAAAAPTTDVEAPNFSTPLRQAVTQSATAANIELLRIGQEADGQIEVQPSQTGAESLFDWLAELDGAFGVRVIFADITRAENGEANAVILTFARS